MAKTNEINKLNEEILRSILCERQNITTLQMAKQIYAKRPTYIDYCKENGYLCKNGTPRLTAEILYRFIMRDKTFTESHTGLEDVMIEKEILVHILRQHKKIRRTYYCERV